MPANVVHCQTCRALLNPDLDPDTVEIPQFVPLQEIGTLVEVQPAGYYLNCPACGEELRIGRKYVGEKVACKHCSHPFRCDIGPGGQSAKWFYAPCPECQQELRVGTKYLGAKVACKHCEAKIHFVQP
jgi:DNA-directed RNA polymerase subunit RPC12/RpoP